MKPQRLFVVSLAVVSALLAATPHVVMVFRQRTVHPTPGSTFSMVGANSTHQKSISAEGPVSGTVKWRRRIALGAQPITLTGPPVSDTNGNIIVTTDTGVLATTLAGKTLWTYVDPTIGVYFQSAAIDKSGRVYVVNSRQQLICILPPGRKLWQSKVVDINAGAGNPTIDNGGNIFVFSGLAVTKFRNDGTILWRLDVNEALAGPGAIDQYGNCYIAAHAGQILKISPKGIVLNKSEKLDAYLGEEITLDTRGNVYVGTSSGLLVALGSDLKVKWKMQAQSQSLLPSSPAVGGSGNLYYATTDGDACCCTTAGLEKWRVAIGNGSRSGCIVDAKENMYFITVDGRLISLDGSGSYRWSLQISEIKHDCNSLLAMGPRGDLYFVGGSGMLFCVGD